MRGILFDKDGTLIDFHASWSGVYRELGLELAGGDAERAAAMLAAGGMDPHSKRVQAGSVLAAGNTIDIAKLFFPELGGTELEKLVARIDAIFFENGIRCSVPVPGLAETLAALAETGIAMGVATSDGTAAAKAALDALGIAKHLPHVYGYDFGAAAEAGAGHGARLCRGDRGAGRGDRGDRRQYARFEDGAERRGGRRHRRAERHRHRRGARPARRLPARQHRRFARLACGAAERVGPG